MESTQNNFPFEITFGKRFLVDKAEKRYEQSVTINQVEFIGDPNGFSDVLALLLHDSDEAVLEVAEVVDPGFLRDLESAGVLEIDNRERIYPTLGFKRAGFDIIRVLRGHDLVREHHDRHRHRKAPSHF